MKKNNIIHFPKRNKDNSNEFPDWAEESIKELFEDTSLEIIEVIPFGKGIDMDSVFANEIDDEEDDFFTPVDGHILCKRCATWKPKEFFRKAKNPKICKRCTEEFKLMPKTKFELIVSESHIRILNALAEEMIPDIVLTPAESLDFLLENIEEIMFHIQRSE